MAFPSEAKQCRFDWKRFKSEENGHNEKAINESKPQRGCGNY